MESRVVRELLRRGWLHSPMTDEDSKLSTGRLARLAKLAKMSAKLSTDVFSRG